MGRKYGLYNALPVIVFVVLGTPAVLIYSGNAEPYVDASQLPVHPGLAFVGLILTVFATAIVSGVLIRRSFARTCRSLGLSKEGGGLFGGKPDFTGTMQGRPVRVETRTVRRSSGGEGGSNSTTYTNVAAELDRPLEDGFVLVDDDGDVESEAMADVPDEVKKVPVGDGFSVIGAANEPLAREILTPAVVQTLREPGTPEELIVGDPADAILEALPEEFTTVGSFLGGDSVEEKLREEIGGDAPTVCHESKRLPLDADGLESRLDATIAVADAVDAVDRSVTAAEPTSAA